MNVIEGEWFLWIGFIFSTLVQLFGWRMNTTRDHDHIISVLLCLIGGVSFCVFGYLLFS